jgi:AcrR family transcriptional regulator
MPGQIADPTPPRPRPGGRSARVVHDVLEATLEELALHGYGALRVDDVALRAGVNKTTVYRRWPTKADLVRSALLKLSDEKALTPDTGALHTDMLELARRSKSFTATPRGRSILSMLFVERAEPELAAIAQSLRGRRDAAAVRVVERALERGELPPGTDPQLILEPLHAVVYRRVMLLQEALDEAFLVRLIDLILAGARQGAALLPAASARE